MTDSPAKGWAIIDRDGVIDLRTVGPTRRSALVNFLHCNGVPMLSFHPDEYVEDCWKRAQKRHEVRVAEVSIVEQQ